MDFVVRKVDGKLVAVVDDSRLVEGILVEADRRNSLAAVVAVAADLGDNLVYFKITIDFL